MVTHKTKAIAVVRVVNVKGQQTQGYGVEHQKQRIAKLAIDENAQVIKWFMLSGNNESEIARALNFCKSDPDIKHLYTTEVTRLTRSVERYSSLRQSLNKLGVTIRTCDGFEHNSPKDVFIDSLLVTMSQFNSAHRSNVTKQKMHDRVENGFSITRPPLGYKPTTIRGVYEPSALGGGIGEVMRRVATDRLSLPEAVGLIQAMVKIQTGREVAKGSVLKVLSDPYYAGKLKYQDKLYEGNHRPVITTEQHLAILKLVHKSNSKNIKNSLAG